MTRRDLRPVRKKSKEMTPSAKAQIRVQKADRCMFADSVITGNHRALCFTSPDSGKIYLLLELSFSDIQLWSMDSGSDAALLSSQDNSYHETKKVSDNGVR